MRNNSLKAMFKILVIALGLLYPNILLADSIIDDNLKIGHPLSDADKILEFEVSNASFPNVKLAVEGTSGATVTLGSDSLTLGTGDDDNMELLFDTGVANPSMPGLLYDSSLDLLHVRENKVKIGKELAEDIDLLFGTSAATTTLPTIRWDNSDSKFVQSVDGISFTPLGGLEQFSFAGANNQASPVNVTGMEVSGHSAVKFIVAVIIDATSDLAALCDINTIDIGGTWSLSQECTGSGSLNVNFSISGTQVQYTSDNYAGFVSLDFKWKEIVID